MRLIEAGLLVFLALASNIRPVFRLPRPTGPFPVGTVTQTLDGEGSLALQIWYPAAPTARAPAAPYEPATGGWRNWVFRHVRTDALQDAPLAAGTDRFPVLVYVNGWGGTRWENSALMQERQVTAMSSPQAISLGAGWTASTCPPHGTRLHRLLGTARKT